MRQNTTTHSEEYPKLYGLAPDHPPFTPEQWISLVHPDDRERLQALVREGLEKTHVWDTEFRVVWSDGSVHWLLGKGNVFLDDSSRPNLMAGVNFDITKRKQAEAALQESQARFKGVFDIASDCIFLVDVTPDARFKFAGLNPAAEKAVGVLSAEVSGTHGREPPAEAAGTISLQSFYWVYYLPCIS